MSFSKEVRQIEGRLEIRMRQTFTIIFAFRDIVCWNTWSMRLFDEGHFFNPSRVEVCLTEFLYEFRKCFNFFHK